MDPIKIIADYYKNDTGKDMNRYSPQKDVELAITRATVGMEFKARHTTDRRKQEKYVHLHGQLKKITYGTVCSGFLNNQ